MALALDRKAYIDILSGGKALHERAPCMPPPEGKWGMPPEMLKTLPGYGDDVEKSRAEARKIMEGLGYGDAKPLKVKVSTRNIAIYRDPAVILIDQLKKIHIDGELEVIDTCIWHAKVDAQGLLRRPQPDRRRRRRSRRQPLRELRLQLGAQPHQVLQQGGRRADRQAVGRRPTSTKRKEIVWEIETRAGRGPRPADHLSTTAPATCWQPHVKGFVLHHNSIYNNWRYEDVWLDK